MLTPTQAAILSAVEQGHRSTRAIAAAIGLAANSNVARQLQSLASAGHLILEQGPHGLTIADGQDYAAGWDAAARAMGNPDA